MSLIRESHDIPRRFPWGALATAFVAIALVVAAKLVVDGIARAAHEPEHRTIDAVGTAKRHVALEQAEWDLAANANAKDQRQSLKLVTAAAETLRTFLVDHEIRPDEIEMFGATSTADVATGSDYMGALTASSPTTFTATQKLTVRSTDVARVLRAFRAATRDAALASDDVGEPTCSLRNADPLQHELLEAARGDVRADALHTLARLGGAELGALESTSSSFDIDPDASSKVASCANGSDLVATVRATYRIE